MSRSINPITTSKRRYNRTREHRMHVARPYAVTSVLVEIQHARPSPRVLESKGWGEARRARCRAGPFSSAHAAELLDDWLFAIEDTLHAVTHG
jgi:hypothetical protein